MNNKDVLISDLDKTLIFTNNEGIKDSVCVEYKLGKELSYMTNRAYKDFKMLMNEGFLFIPLTMRSLEQVKRIDLINEVNPEFIACFNGAELYYKGEIVKEYQKNIEKFLKIKEIEKMVEKYSKIFKNNRIISFKNYYFEIKSNNLEEKEKIIKKVISEIDLTKYKIITHSLKIYVMPVGIDKIEVVGYIREKFSNNNIFCMGDGQTDELFVNAADYSLAPKHLEFNIKEDNSFISLNSGIKGGEELIIKVMELLNRRY